MEKKYHTIAIIVQNKKGVLNKVTSIIRRRQYNIQTITAGPIEKNDVTRINIVIEAEKDINKLINQLDKIIEVVKIFEINTKESINRELLLISIDKEYKKILEIELFKDLNAKIIEQNENLITVELIAPPEDVEKILHMIEKGKIVIKRFARSGVVSIKK